MLADENKGNIVERFPLHNVLHESIVDSAMANPTTKTITFRPTTEDRRLVNRLAGKLGIKTSQVIKIALRRLAESEGMRA